MMARKFKVGDFVRFLELKDARHFFIKYHNIYEGIIIQEYKDGIYLVESLNRVMRQKVMEHEMILNKKFYSPLYKALNGSQCSFDSSVTATDSKTPQNATNQETKV